MAVAVDGDELIDPYGGAADIEARTLRVLGAGAYEADPLRALRLARLAGELGFEPNRETERLTIAAAPRVVEASAERIWAELRRLIVSDGALAALSLADRLGLLAGGAARGPCAARGRAEPVPPPRRVRAHDGGAP